MNCVSIVVPTFKEVENIPVLVEAVEALANSKLLTIELVIVDDDSQDGTEKLVKELQKPWVRLIVRKGDRGLSQSVLEGMRQAIYDTVVVMDADLSHPVEAIPRMVETLEKGNDVVVGSRYVKDASTDETWGLFRWINSKVAVLLARPLTAIKDPMSGFFACRRSILGRAEYLNPTGYKILLELLVKCHTDRVAEVPIHFSDRRAGYSKLNFKQQLLYLVHLRRLMIYQYSEVSYLTQFVTVGASGLITNILALTALLVLGCGSRTAVAGGITFSIFTNFLLNRRFSFSYARHRPILDQFARFAGACTLGGLINYSVTLVLIENYPFFYDTPQYAALIGIAYGIIFNYAINRYLVFAK